MDWLDEAVRRAAPPALGSDAAAGEQAVAAAHAVLADAPKRGRRPGLRRTIAGSVLGIGLLGLGVTAAVAAPSVLDWLGWTPDVVAQRSFTLENGGELGLCEVFFQVSPDYQNAPKDVADQRTEAARQFLTEHDWEPLIASITESEIQAAFDLDAERRSVRSDDGTLPPPATLSNAATQVMYDRIADEFERAGYLQHGVSLGAAGEPCSGASESPAN